MKTGRERRVARKKKNNVSGRILDLYSYLKTEERLFADVFNNSFTSCKPNKHKLKKLRNGGTTRKPSSENSPDSLEKGISDKTYEGMIHGDFGDERPIPRKDCN